MATSLVPARKTADEKGRSPTRWLADYLRNYAEPGRSPGFHISQIQRQCARELALSALTNTPKQTIGIGLRWRFDVGHALHHWMQDNYFGEMGVLEGMWRCQCSFEKYGLRPKKPHCKGLKWEFAEIKVRDEETTIVGSCDGILQLGDRRIAMDIKTVNPEYYLSMTEPSIDYVWQLNCYMHLLKLDAGVIFCVVPTMQEGVDQLPTKEYFLEYDSKIWDACSTKALEAKKIMASVEAGKKYGTVPCRHDLCATPTSRRAKDCPVRDICFNDKKTAAFFV